MEGKPTMPGPDGIRMPHSLLTEIALYGRFPRKGSPYCRTMLMWAARLSAPSTRLRAGSLGWIQMAGSSAASMPPVTGALKATGLRESAIAPLAKVFAVVFALLAVFAAFGGGNMFQINQTASIIVIGQAGSYGVRDVVSVKDCDRVLAGWDIEWIRSKAGIALNG